MDYKLLLNFNYESFHRKLPTIEQQIDTPTYGYLKSENDQPSV